MADDATKINDGGPAFPVDLAGVPRHPGMSLRDWFAGQAIPKAYETTFNECQAIGASEGALTGKLDLSLVAIRAYRLADAMLARRAKSG